MLGDLGEHAHRRRRPRRRRPAAAEGRADRHRPGPRQAPGDRGDPQARLPQAVAAHHQRGAHPPGGGVAGHVDQRADGVGRTAVRGELVI